MLFLSKSIVNTPGPDWLWLVFGSLFYYSMVMYLLIPGRHHALTSFQFQYIHRFSSSGFKGEKDLLGKDLPDEALQGVIFSVTSSNHSGTRRNPFPFHLRAMAIEAFSSSLDVPLWVAGIPDVGVRRDFASFVLKSLDHELALDLVRENTIVACSTFVAKLYLDLGFQVWGAEASDWKDVLEERYRAPQPWELVERAAASEDWKKDPKILMEMHPACYRLWKHYDLGQKVKVLFMDPIVGADGDLTDHRDYSHYVRQMDEIASLKWQETFPFLRRGRIGDIGCAVGSWLRQAASEPSLRECDFYGIEIARPLFEICQQRKINGEFLNPNVWFSQKNAVSSLVFEKASMTTIHTGSITHEIFSYGSLEDLRKFIQNRRRELSPGGIWINRDVVGPENGDETIVLEVISGQGKDLPWDSLPEDNQEAKKYLDELSPLGLWRQFLNNWRKGEGTKGVIENQGEGSCFISCSRSLCAEFLLHKDYKDNWKSEMEESFCFWSFSQWKSVLEEEGFRILPGSRSWTNPWIRENRLEKGFRIWKDVEKSQGESWPPTTMILAAEV